MIGWISLLKSSSKNSINQRLGMIFLGEGHVRI
jgi:hypothetical protein